MYIYRWPGTKYTGGDVLAIFMSIIMGAMGMGQVGPQLSAILIARGSVKSIYEIIARKSEIDPLDTEHGHKFVTAPRGKISFKNVKFTYPTRQEVQVLNDLNVSFEAGTTVALVGASGCGKSTIIQLIERFYDPTSGSVVIDDQHDLKDINVANWRSFVGLVAQEPVLFAATVRENIRYGNPKATDDEIEAVAKAANAHHFIMKLPKGYDTLVGEGGKLMSGGQKQRLAIARALIKNPSVLLLDEATSALDTASERIVQKALDKLLADKSTPRTTIIIAHRLSTIKNADRILVLDRGQVIEDGNHSALLAKGGLYASLVAAQERKEENHDEEEDVNEDAFDGDAETEDEEEELVNVEHAGHNTPGTTTSTGSTAGRGRGVSVSQSATKASKLGRERSGSGKKGDDDPSTEEERVERSTLSKAGLGRTASNKSASGRKADISKVRESEEKKVQGDDATTEEEGTKAAEEKKEEKPAPKLNVGLSRVFAFNKPDAHIIALGVLAAGGEGVLFPLYAIIFAGMSASFYANNASEMMEMSEKYALYFFFLGFGGLVCSIVRVSCLSVASQRMTRTMRSLSFERILQMDMSWHDEERNAPSVLVTRLATDATLVSNVTSDRLAQFVQLLANLTAGLTIAFVNGWKLALVTLSIFPLLLVASVIQMQFLGGYGGKTKEALARAGQVAAEGVGAIRTVKSFGGELTLLAKFDEKITEIANVGARGAHAAGAGFGFSTAVLYFGYALCFWYGGKLVSEGELTFESMIEVFFALMMSAMSIGQTMQVAPDLNKAIAATNDIFTLLDSKSKINYADETGVDAPMTKAEVELKNVFFHYPTRPNVPVLRGLNLKAEGGKVLAIVGESGSGKSTIMGLVQRFYDPLLPTEETVASINANIAALVAKAAESHEQKESSPFPTANTDPFVMPKDPGAIYIDGVDIKTMKVSELRKYFGVVAQEPTLFSGTIADNIRFGNPDLTNEQMYAAAELANIHQFIEKRLPKKYDTTVGSKGAQLSGGQKQRIAIARAIARNPKILLLDEATSALDSKSERKVQQALDRAMQGRTTIVVAHRLSTVKHADAIAVMGEGKLIEGPLPHAELVKLDGVYARLVEAAALTEDGTLGKAKDKNQDKEKEKGTKVKKEKAATSR